MASKVSGLATARKMAKKGGQVSLQIEVNNDDDWAALLERQGLVVIDIYTEWCGPCVAMMSNLKKLKLESGVDQFHLALANASTIEALYRFKGRSEPTWMILGSGHLLKVMFGSNAPYLTKNILKELEKEVKCMAGLAIRKALPFDEPTPEEIVKLDEIEIKRLKEAEREKKELAIAMDKVRRRNLERLSRVMNNVTLVVFFPIGIVEPEDLTHKRVCAAAYKLMTLYDTVGLLIVDQLDIQLTREELDEMMYNSGVVLPEEVLQSIDARACIASLVQEMSPVPLERHSSSTSQLSMLSVGGTLDLVERKMATLVYGERMDPLNPASDSVAKAYEVEIDGNRLISLWTPVEHLSKSAALQILFPTKVQNANVPVDILPPPSYVIIFEAKRAHEILDVAKQFADDVLHVAYFDSIEPDKAKKIAGTIWELEKKGEGKVNDTKMVMALRKMSSDPMLTLAQMNPLYISSDLVTGTKEMEQFFPPTVEAPDEPDPWAPAPPEPKVYWTDEEENVYVEENKVTFDGDIIKGRRLVKLADGTDVEDGEWIPVEKDEPELPAVADEFEGMVEGEDEDIGLLAGLGPMIKMQIDDEDDEISTMQALSQENFPIGEEAETTPVPQSPPPAAPAPAPAPAGAPPAKTKTEPAKK